MIDTRGRYELLMKVIRKRLDAIKIFSELQIESYHKSEIAAFHGRKIIEGIAFGCLIAVENKVTQIPKDAKGQYNAEKILKSLEKRQLKAFPSPSGIRATTHEEKQKHGAKAIIEGIPKYRITNEELIAKYQRMHNWLHELNPYTKKGQEDFHAENSQQLWTDLGELENFISRHVMSLRGEAFFCILRDNNDNKTKVISLSKIQ